MPTAQPREVRCVPENLSTQCERRIGPLEGAGDPAVPFRVVAPREPERRDSADETQLLSRGTLTSKRRERHAKVVVLAFEFAITALGIAAKRPFARRSPRTR